MEKIILKIFLLLIFVFELKCQSGITTDSCLLQGQCLNQNSYLVSPSGFYQFYLNSNGNLLIQVILIAIIIYLKIILN
jgi:hypothetical protein